jgi:tetratricopeptide (TPR) repeat protein
VAQQSNTTDSLYAALRKFETSKALSGVNGAAEIDTVKIKILSDLVILNYESYPDKALKDSQLQYNLSKAIDYKWGMANALQMQGNIHEFRQKYDKALTFFSKSLSLYNNINYKKSALDVTNNIGIIYAKKGIYTESLKYLLRALTIAKKENDIYGFVSSYNNLGIIYNEQGKYNEALKYYLQCLDLQLKHKGQFAISNTYLNIGQLYLSTNKKTLALKYFLLGIKSAQAENKQPSIANNYSALGNLYIDMGQLDKAMEAQTMALKIRTKINDGLGLFHSYYSFSKLYRKAGDNPKALLYAKKALGMASNGELQMRAEAYGQLSEIYAAMDNYREAYSSERMFKKYSDSVFNSENERKLTEQKMNFEFKYLQEKKDMLAKQALQQEKSIRNYTIAGLAALGFFIIFFLVGRYKRNALQKQLEYNTGISILNDEISIKTVEAHALKIENENIQLKNEMIAVEKEYEKKQNEKLQEKLDFNKRELASTTLYLFEKNQMLSELKIQIDALKEGFIDANNLDRIKTKIQQNLYLDADWDKFKLHFEQVHPDFFKELHQKHPGLTAYEIRLYSYLHIKLSTKEIAGLLNITPASVIKAKVRLNKKLNRNDTPLQD